MAGTALVAYGHLKTRVIEPARMEYKTPEGYSEHLDHFTNFFYAIRTGGSVVEDASFGLRAAGPSLAANMSYFERKPILWDPEKMVVK